MLRLRRYEWISIENRHFRSNVISLTQTFRYKVSPPTNHYSCLKNRINDFSCGIEMWAQVSFILSQSTHLTVRRTDRQTDRQQAFAIPCIALHQSRDKKNRAFSTAVFLVKMHILVRQEIIEIEIIAFYEIKIYHPCLLQCFQSGIEFWLEQCWTEWDNGTGPT